MSYITRWLPSRKHRRVLPLEVYPQTPLPEGYHPASGPLTTHRVSFNVVRQELPAFDDWPETPSVTSPATLGAYLEKKALSRRDIQRSHQLTPELDRFPATPPSAIPERITRSVPFVIREQRSRVLQKLAFIPAVASRIDFFPRQTGFFRRYRFSRHRLDVISLPDTPQTPETLDYYPGSGAVVSFSSRFSITLQTLQYPDVYPETVGPPEPSFAAFAARPGRNRWWETNSSLQHSRLSTYKTTDPAYYTGWYPAAEKPLAANVIRFRQKLQVVENPRDFPLQPTVTEPVVSWQSPVKHVWHDQWRLVKSPQLDSYPRTIQSPIAYAPVKLIRTKQTARVLRLPLEINVYPDPAPPPPPEFSATVLNLAEFRKKTDYRLLQPLDLGARPFLAISDALICRYVVKAESSGYSVNAEVDTYFVPAERQGYTVDSEPEGYSVVKCA